MFISFEGGEGSGKTTQIQKLKIALEVKGYEVVTTREPGGTSEAEKIRELLVQRNGGNWTPLAEAMLFFTARHMHVETKIKPALALGKVVICDRFTDSTIAYQGYGHGFSLEKLNEIKNLCIGDFAPDKTLLLDLPIDIGLSRAEVRMSNQSNDKTEDRFERLNIDFHHRLRNGYLELARLNKKRCTIIDATQTIDDVHSAIISAINL